MINGRAWKKAAAALAVLALLVGILPGVAFASTDAWGAKHALYDEAMARYAASPGDHLAKAIEELDKGFDAKYWLEDFSGLSAKGKKAFDKDAKAAKKLAEAGHPDLAADLAAIDRDLAADAIGAAAGYDTAKASEHYDKGIAKMGEGKPEDAIKEFKKAWEHAMKAIAKAAKAKATSSATYTAGSGGDGITYTFTFVHRITGEFLVVSGSSSGNEGFLISDRFLATDTYLGEDGVMQVHVSCSDAFPGGIGAKSDPEETSQWLVAFADIDKGSKACHLIGTGDGEGFTPGGG